MTAIDARAGMAVPIVPGRSVGGNIEGSQRRRPRSGWPAALLVRVVAALGLYLAA